HDLNDDHAVMSLGGGVDAVDGFCGDADGCVETETDIGAADIVINRFWHADYLGPALVQAERDRLSIVAADGHQRVHGGLLQVFQAALDAALFLRGICARRAQNGAAAGKNARDFVQIQCTNLVVEHAAPAFKEAYEFVVVVKNPLTDDGANNGIQSRAIASSCQ